jgi:hypothetical protein
MRYRTAALWVVPALLTLNGCTEQYSAPIMYQARSPDCGMWMDGSMFGLPADITVTAGKPVQTSPQALDLTLAYGLPLGAEARFADTNFVLSVPYGKAIAKGEVVKVEKLLPAPKWSREPLPLQLQTLRGEVADDITMVKVTIRFPMPLPRRFDFTPPQMIVGGKPYPVRTYTYRWFAPQNVFGLCS